MSEQAAVVEEKIAVPEEATRPAPQRPKHKPLPPYAVIVENDEDHTYPYVIEMLQKVFGYAAQRAYLLTRKIDKTGEALVWSGSKEVAELKRDQVRGYGPDFYASKKVEYPIGVRIEPMPG